MPDYLVVVQGCKPLMVRGPNPAVVRNWAMRERCRVETLSTDDAIALGAEGGKLIDIGANPEATAPLEAVAAPPASEPKPQPEEDANGTDAEE